MNLENPVSSQVVRNSKEAASLKGQTHSERPVATEGHHATARRLKGPSAQ